MSVRNIGTTILLMVLTSAILIGFKFGVDVGIIAFVTMLALKARVPSSVRPVNVKVVKDD